MLHLPKAVQRSLDQPRSAIRHLHYNSTRLCALQFALAGQVHCQAWRPVKMARTVGLFGRHLVLLYRRVLPLLMDDCAWRDQGVWVAG